MSSYAEFLPEAKLLSTITDHYDEEVTVPIVVPHSRRRGTWSEWMKEIKIPPDVLDSIVKRYADSKSWSATGGRTSSAPSREDGASVAGAKVGAKQAKPTLPRPDVAKGGGAAAMRGVHCANRPKLSGRARALRLRSESSQEGQTPGEASFSKRPGDGRQKPHMSKWQPRSSQWEPQPSNRPPQSTQWQPNSSKWETQPSKHSPQSSKWEPQSPKRSSQSSQWQPQPHRPCPFVAPTAHNTSDWPHVSASRCHGRGRMEMHKEGHGYRGQKYEWEESEPFSFEHKRGSGGEGNGSLLMGHSEQVEDADVIEDGVEEEEEESDDSIFHSACELLESDELVRKDGDFVEEGKVVRGEGEPMQEKHGLELAEPAEDEEEEERDIVRMKCGCILDEFGSHSCCPSARLSSRGGDSSMCGERAAPKLPSWADDDHTVVLTNIPTNISEEELEEDVLSFGRVTNCTILTVPNEAGLHTAYVRMKERESCQWVISYFHDMPYGDGASEPMVCHMLKRDSL